MENQFNRAFGMQLTESDFFPTNQQCERCAGTGEGQASTYCTLCGGAGAICIQGLLYDQSGSAWTITERLPKRFQPYFPRGLVAAPPLARGLV